MSPALKFLIGLALVAAMGWIHHGLLGTGERLIGNLENQAKMVVAKTEVPGVEVRLGYDPLSRLATFSGNADPFQREGQGELKGLNDRVRDIDGISGVRWTDEADKTAIPLFLEVLAQLVAAYLIGLGIAWLLFGRARRESFY
jgi:hypothetical protein